MRGPRVRAASGPGFSDSPGDEAPASSRPPPRTARVGGGSARLVNRLMLGALGAGFALTVIPLFLILGYITVRGAGAVEWNLFTERGRPGMPNALFERYQEAKREGKPPPTNDVGKPAARGGVGHAMLGSVVIVGVATAMAVPVGLLAAVYLAEARQSPLARAVRFAAELLGGVPSIVVGIFAYSVLVNPFWYKGDPFGASGLAGSAALAVMMIPILVRSAEESMRLVPESLRQASFALGASRMQTTLRVILPAALPAIITGVFLAIGRIAGETAPLLLTAGSSQYWPKSPAEETPYLPYYIYTYSRSAYADEQQKAWAATLVLLAAVVLLNLGIRLASGKRVVAAARAD